jgi:glycosyltransferase involved in cell wall biosynthesis
MESKKRSERPNRVGMVAYTNYRSDGRVRLEAESLVKWGYEVFFLVPKGGQTAREYTLAGVDVIELNVDKYGGRSKLHYLRSYLVFMALAFAACTQLYFKRGVSVIHVHNMPDVLIFSTLIPRLLGCRIVLDLHDTVVETYQAKFGKSSSLTLFLLRLEEQICCAMAHQIICVNHVQREAVLSRGVPAKKVATVITMPNFPHDNSLRAAKRRDSHFRMVNHGTLSKRLGNDLIIEAAARLIREIPGFELHIIGGGDGLPELQSMVTALNLEQHVHLHKGVPWDQLAAKLEYMDVGIVANRVNVATELMLPSKLIDYVVLGIPAIVPRMRAIEYYFSDEMVTFFTPEDLESMVAATVGLYQSAIRRQRQAESAKAFLREHGWEKGGLRTIYERLIPSVENSKRAANLKASTDSSPSAGDTVHVVELSHHPSIQEVNLGLKDDHLSSN